MICPQCKQRPGTEIWAGEGGSLAYVHGAYTYWCKSCVLTAQLAYARERAADIPRLEAALAAVSPNP